METSNSSPKWFSSICKAQVSSVMESTHLAGMSAASETLKKLIHWISSTFTKLNIDSPPLTHSGSSVYRIQGGLKQLTKVPETASSKRTLYKDIRGMVHQPPSDPLPSHTPSWLGIYCFSITSVGSESWMSLPNGVVPELSWLTTSFSRAGSCGWAISVHFVSDTIIRWKY